MKGKIKGIVWGVSVVVVVLLVNLIVLSLLDFPIMAMNIIYQYWYLLVLLIGGLGFQVGLFVYFNSLNAIGCSTVAVSGGISTVSMILCCSHYLLNILPFLGAIIGISFFSFLTRYTFHFLILGVVSNAIGIGVLFYQKNKYSKGKK